MIGMLINARMIAPFKTERPVVEPKSRIKMDIIVRPINPQTTEGIAASNSITTFNISFNRVPQNSEINIAPPKLNGTAIVIANIATLNVPNMIRAAPKLAGS